MRVVSLEEDEHHVSVLFLLLLISFTLCSSKITTKEKVKSRTKWSKRRNCKWSRRGERTAWMV
jgi:hypothetical protein